MTVSKTTYVFTVLHLDDNPMMSLEHALQEASEGHAVGAVIAEAITPLTDGEVQAELIVLGNDGEFFDDDLEDGR